MASPSREIPFTVSEWNSTHADYRGETDGVKRMTFNDAGATKSIPVRVFDVENSETLISDKYYK